ncbi:DNA-binding protein YbiB [Limnobacter humi]|uniref:DNA-binding protein YbiB n=1 Tax=Limnobacter humi TaxID=1778671 RepID=A0ABT1WHT0_9BURK|nr:DNA-binding protein YbiB [Limnobacter humi]MCQ8896969.1 DNA-binding protein YbiB [Limnobacter humi]
MSAPSSTTPFSAAAFIKEIGRGKDGARSLPIEQAQALFAGILRGDVPELELGAVLIALRVKGETEQEITGFLQAIAQHPAACSERVSSTLSGLNEQAQRTGRPVVVIPSYNGARRKPNFTPLLAGLLAHQGYPVLVHGLGTESGARVTSAAVFQHLQWPMPCPPVYLSMAELNPAVARLLELRNRLGVRNCTHTLVKLLVPASLTNSVLVTSYTHPEFWHLQRAVLQAMGQTALVLRAHEGEPVAAPYRVPRMDGVKAGATWCISEPEAVFTEQPDPHPDIDAQATARLVERWLADPQAMPHGFARQVDAIAQVVNANL